MSVRVRFAPSPTGPFHIGNARSALFNYLFARQQKGKCILRIDDTDTERSEKHFEIEMKEAFEWLDIAWDEEFHQSERIDIYAAHLERLLAQKKIFWCPHTPEELDSQRTALMKNKQAPIHICSFREGERNEGGKGILRFKNDAQKDIVFEDMVRGAITFDPSLLGDFSVAKNMRKPLYNFTTVVDDALMYITHIIRGEDHIPNTPKQILLQEAFRFTMPLYAHLPLILGSDRSKLSKRHGAIAVMQYKKDGYLASAFLNFLALLGWHPEQKQKTEKGREEIFSRKELIELFSLSRIQKGGAMFDAEKLRWMNSVYIRDMNVKELSKALFEYLRSDWQKIAQARHAWWTRIVAIEQSRLVLLADIVQRVDYYFETPSIEKEILLSDSLRPNMTIHHLKKIHALIDTIQGAFSRDALHAKVMPYAEQQGEKEVLWPFRVALTGKRASAGLFEVAELLGKETAQERLMHAIKLLET